MGVDCSSWLDVSCDRWAEVGFLSNLLQSLNTVVSVGKHILVDSLNSLIVVLKSMLNLISWVLRILNAPGLWVSNGALWWSIWLWCVLWLMVRGRFMVGSWFMVRGGFMVWGRLVVRSWLMVSGNCMVHWHFMIGSWSSMDYWSGIDLWCVDWGGVVHWLSMSIRGRGRSVAIDTSVDSSMNCNWSSSMVDWDCGISICFSSDTESQGSYYLKL